MTTTMDRFSLEGRVAVVTGGTRGLGEGFAGALADAGWTVREYEAHYAYTLTSPDGRERLRYIEGDVYIA